MHLSLFPTTQAPSQARRWLAPLGQQIDETSLSDVKTVFGELVTLSVLHGASRPIEMSLEVFDDKLEGVVDDHGPGTRAIIRAKERTDNPLPLRIIDALVEEWGTDSDENRVWFLMDVQPLADDHS